MSILVYPTFRVKRKGKTGLFQLAEPMKYMWAAMRCIFNVPVGFETDFASVPRPFRNIVAVNGRHRLPAVLHDYLYSKGGTLDNIFDSMGEEVTYTREDADRVFHRAMREEGVGRFKSAVMYRAVRIFGGSHWNERAKV